MKWCTVLQKNKFLLSFLFFAFKKVKETDAS